MKKYLLMFGLLLIGAMGFSGVSEASENNAGNLKELNAKQASIVTVAAFTAQGDLENLKGALNTALDNGLTINQVKEVLMQMYAYAGFPRSLNGLNTFKAVVEERQAAGINDVLGPDATPVDPNRDRLAIGEKNQTEVAGRRIEGGVYDFAPQINVFLREHLFGDIFERDVLNRQERELATVGALAGIGNVNSQLAGHMQCNLNVGITKTQLQDVITVLREDVGASTADNAEKVLSQVLNK